jgi:hypothetical protein
MASGPACNKASEPARAGMCLVRKGGRGDDREGWGWGSSKLAGGGERGGVDG